MTLNEYLIANRDYFTAYEFAKLIRVDPESISMWRNEKRSVPIHHCVVIEQVTDGQVTRKELRPNDYALIWPDLTPRS